MCAATAVVSTKPEANRYGLAYWMERVLEECERASADFAPDPVHDLRVALRRCRSLADGLSAIDPDPSWKQMKKAAKLLFGRLGELRDSQVMTGWVKHVGAPDDPVTGVLLQSLLGREAFLKQQAAQALQEFDHKQWGKWSQALPRRAARWRTGSAVFKHLALEHWTEARELHSRAMRNRSQVAWHSLRIGLKRFRYIVENFLPEHHEAWIGDLKHMQDLLGEVHDLDVLWTTALQIRAFQDPDARARWRDRLQEERSRRIQQYQTQMAGKDSLWQVWRDQLPEERQIRAIALRRVKLWGAVLDPRFRHSVHVARLALQLYDGLRDKPSIEDATGRDERTILQVAALLQDVGLSKKGKSHHKASYRLIGRLKPPLGLSVEILQMAGVVARYHRGVLPRAGQQALSGLAPPQRQTAIRLAGILRLANAFDADHSGHLRQLEVRSQNGFLMVTAPGYNPRSSVAEKIASARHLLETVYRRPILVKGQRPRK